MSDDGHRRRWFLSAALGLFAAAIGVLSGWDGAVAKLEEISPYAAAIARPAAVFVVVATLFWLGALAWQPFTQWRDQHRRSRADAAVKAERQRKDEVRKLIEDVKWLYYRLRDRNRFSAPFADPIDAERARVIVRDLAERGLFHPRDRENGQTLATEHLGRLISRLDAYGIERTVAMTQAEHKRREQQLR